MQMMQKKFRVILGMSGGVDSSVAAYLLKEQGYEVIGLFMKNWEEIDASGVCRSEKDYADVVKVCTQLDIPYYSINLAKEYQEFVFKQFVEDYKRGFTPNPDIFCNKEIKFKFFYDYAMSLGADYVATGHYCRVGQSGELLKGVDSGKDQSYFLCAIDQSVLKNVLFPVGKYNKTEIRKIANEAGLATKDKKDSTGICFIGERDFKEFLSRYIKSQKGEFRTLDEKVVGHHDGMCFYTLGQRKGLGLGGAGEPWFVVKKDTKGNIVYVERGDDHPALYTSTVEVEDFNWLVHQEQKSFRGFAKIRYRQRDQACLIDIVDQKRLKLTFDEPQRAVTPHQFAAIYSGEICLGGGMII